MQIGAIGQTSNATSLISDGLRLVKNGFVEVAYHGVGSLIKTPIESLWIKCQNKNLRDVTITTGSEATNNDGHDYSNLSDADATINLATTAPEGQTVRGGDRTNSETTQLGIIEIPTATALTSATLTRGGSSGRF